MTSHVELEAAVADLQARRNVAIRDRIRAEASRDAAIAARDAAREELARVFNTSTAEEAQAVLDKLKAELAEIMGRITTILDDNGV